MSVKLNEDPFPQYRSGCSDRTAGTPMQSLTNMNEKNAAPDREIPRVFVAEYLTGGGMFDTPVDAINGPLLGEAVAMWGCLVEDVLAWGQVCTPIDPRLSLSLPDHDRIQSHPMQPCLAPWEQWIKLARDCEFAILVIPETDGLLTKGISLMRAAGIEVLAPNGAAIGVSADKWASAKWLHHEGIAHPDTWSLDRQRWSDKHRSHPCSRIASPNGTAFSRTDPVFSGFPENGYLIKPRDGCGSMSIRQYDELEPALASMQTHEITQQRLGGRSASVIVIGDRLGGDRIMLPAVWQDIEEVPLAQRVDGATTSHLIQRGGCGPVPVEMQLRAHALVDRVLQALPGRTCGFIGIDLILGDDANHDAVIEINARLTTSYIGLRQMSDTNLTERLFRPNLPAPHILVPTESVCWQIDLHVPAIGN